MTDKSDRKIISLNYIFIRHSRGSLLYPDSSISMDEEIVLRDMIWSYNLAEL